MEQDIEWKNKWKSKCKIKKAETTTTNNPTPSNDTTQFQITPVNILTTSPTFNPTLYP